MTISGLRELTEHPGPFASVYIETVSDTEDAAHQQRLRSRAVREALDGNGADRAVLDAVERGLSDPPPGRAGQAVIADADGVLLTEALPEPPARTTVRLSSMPYLLPLLQLRSPAMAHVVAVVDDRGADLYTVDGDGHRTDHRTEGAQHPVHKAHGGGWAHRSMQSRVEETVRRTIDATAEEVVRLADEAGAGLIVVAGEISARTALVGALASHHRRVVQIDGFTRHTSEDRADLDRRVGEVLQDLARTRVRDVLGEFEQRRAHELAVQGLPGVAAALTERNVETLLIDPAVIGDRAVHVGQDPTAVQASDLPSGRGVVRRADEALPLAALAAGADIVTIDRDPAPTDGVAALLRHR
ncbi:baeRF2 domain-containing protein [Nocardia cerradoensis]|uniref:Rv2629 family ribosome hibernation factor n=1 Tax=Nocardia cerradoensis TaxID=85688 RepID=UPI000B8B1FCB|nr:Vms1/Ankzf1 family peptidyl-tRNA hydrolase [Nocardia cerradoensis]